MTVLLDMKDVARHYGEGPGRVDALKGVDLQVSAGEFVAIMGPSGSGKSTLLTIAGGLESPSSGQVVVAGSDISEKSVRAVAELRRERIGYVFQEINLLSGLTAAENVAAPLELGGTSAGEARTLALAGLDEVGLKDRAGAFADDLSGGERQRVAIARGLIGGRDLLLADEPTGALDTDSGEGVMALLRGAAFRGAAIVMVTHNSGLASWADRIVSLKDGLVVSESAADGPGSAPTLARKCPPRSPTSAAAALRPSRLGRRGSARAAPRHDPRRCSRPSGL